jgi:hypothetical protein
MSTRQERRIISTRQEPSGGRNREPFNRDVLSISVYELVAFEGYRLAAVRRSFQTEPGDWQLLVLLVLLLCFCRVDDLASSTTPAKVTGKAGQLI